MQLQGFSCRKTRNVDNINSIQTNFFSFFKRMNVGYNLKNILAQSRVCQGNRIGSCGNEKHSF